MSQVPIYLKNELVKRMQSHAKNEGVSQNQWIARLIEEKLEQSWPTSFNELAGAWSDFPVAEALRQDHGKDHPRVPF